MRRVPRNPALDQINGLVRQRRRVICHKKPSRAKPGFLSAAEFGWLHVVGDRPHAAHPGDRDRRGLGVGAWVILSSDGVQLLDVLGRAHEVAERRRGNSRLEEILVGGRR